uniref:Uncharacterized protein n=1 Tax=Panagrolaimus sp. PS1159 TaxID=55785 RepID=A0AC35FMU0_9BILA
MRNKVILKAPVYTTPLIFIAVNIVVISFFFSFNDIDVPIKPAAKWAVQRIYEIGPIKSSINYIRSSIGLPSLQRILDWIKFYEKDYKVVAIVEGIYYTNDGKPTERLEEVKKQLEKAVEWKEKQQLEKAVEWKEKQVKETEVFPPCNSEWHKDSGGRVWCTTKSGGINREWVGVPRRLFNSATKSYRCACVKNFGPPLASPGSKGNRGDLDNPSLKEYDDCSPTANSCKIHNN